MRSTVSLFMGNYAPKFLVGNLSIEMSRFGHELATVEFVNQDINPSDVKDGTPISASITVGSDVRQFVGYISHSTAQYRREVSNTSIVCIGSTYIMKKPSQKIWRNLTATSIATSICESYRLSHNIVPHKRVFPQMSQAGMSDWKFLGYLARYIGYSLYSEGSSVHFAPRLQSWNDNQSKAPIFNLRQSGTPTVGFLKEFYPVLGDSLPTEDGMLATPFMSGIDPRTPQQITQGKTGTKKTIRAVPSVENFTYFGSNTVVNSAEEAQYESDAYIERNAFPLRATAVVIGNPNLKPDYPIYIVDVGNAYDGYWLVDSVSHMVDGDQYDCHLSLVSDSTGRTANGATPPNPNIVTFGGTEILRSVSNIAIQSNLPQLLPSETVVLSQQPKWAGKSSNLRVSLDQGLAPAVVRRSLSHRS